MNIFITKKHSKKTNKDYVALVAKKHDKETLLTFDYLVIYRLVGKKKADILKELEKGDIIL